jgi:hypothetical protein
VIRIDGGEEGQRGVEGDKRGEEGLEGDSEGWRQLDWLGTKKSGV